MYNVREDEIAISCSGIHDTSEVIPFISHQRSTYLKGKMKPEVDDSTQFKKGSN
jgi:hypothetical protein